MALPRVLAIVGPTASGKTGISYLLARLIKERLNQTPVIISADSRQVYKHIPIASSYPPQNYLKEFKHYFIGKLELEMEFNAGRYGKEAREVINETLSGHKIPIVVGGSGLYISSLIYGLFDFDEAPDEAEDESGFKEKKMNIRKQLSDKLKNEGIEALLSELKKVDEVSARKMSNVNQRRIIRALEVYYTTGIPISQLQKKKIDVGFEAIQFGLNWERRNLYDRINRRVDQMIEQSARGGLVEEIKSLSEKGCNYRDYNSLNTVGVKEVFDYLDEKTSYDKMVELIKQNTRRFAKRQLTWFRKDKNIKWIDADEVQGLESIAEKIFESFFKVE
jgi:tRNA dimethylallyltransferase